MEVNHLALSVLLVVLKDPLLLWLLKYCGQYANVIA